jgi:hypothetical protein
VLLFKVPRESNGREAYWIYPPYVHCGIIQAIDYKTALNLAQTHGHFRPLVDYAYSQGYKLSQMRGFQNEHKYIKASRTKKVPGGRR